MSFELTLDQLKQIVPGNPYIDHWHEALCEILPDYDIDTPQRVAAFLAQCAHESGGFKAIKENLNYRAESLIRTWPSHFNASNAQEYAHNPEKIASRAYANRMGNGDEESQEGWLYRGRGYLQLTGKKNYELVSNDLQIDFVSSPDIVGTVDGAMATAGWFWEKHNLNAHSDNGDVESVTKIINGGTIGLENRQARYEQALSVLEG